MLVEDLVQRRLLWEMLGNKGEESVSNVGLHAFTIRRVEPRNIPLTSMRHERYEQRTELAKHVWTLKRGNVDPSISWSIIARAPAYNASSKICHLCLSEKLAIILWPKEKRLNKRPELVSTCRHQNKVLLANFTRIT